MEIADRQYMATPVTQMAPNATPGDAVNDHAEGLAASEHQALAMHGTTFYCIIDFHCARGCGPAQNGHTCNGNNC